MLLQIDEINFFLKANLFPTFFLSIFISLICIITILFQSLHVYHTSLACPYFILSSSLRSERSIADTPN